MNSTTTATLSTTTTVSIMLTFCIQYIGTSLQKPPTTYTRVNDFGPHTDSILGGRATYTRERLIRYDTIEEFNVDSKAEYTA